MVRYIKGNFYGYDENGEEIDESTVEELYRIAEYEVLPTTELAKLDRNCTIDEDSFDYYASTTNWGSMVSFEIRLTITTDDIDVMKYARPDATYLYDYRNGKNVGEIEMFIGVINNEIDAVDIIYSDIDLSQYDTDAIEAYVKELAEPAVHKIVQSVTIV